MSEQRTIFMTAEHLKQLAYGEIKSDYVVVNGETILIRVGDVTLPKRELAAINFVRSLNE